MNEKKMNLEKPAELSNELHSNGKLWSSIKTPICERMNGSGN